MNSDSVKFERAEPADVADGFLLRVDVSRGNEPGHAVVELDPPAGLDESAVVVGAERDHVVDVRLAANRPVEDVMQCR